MPDDIFMQILSQTSENIQQLFDLSTRIDERVKSIQRKQVDLDRQFEAGTAERNLQMQKLAILESTSLAPALSAIKDKLDSVDKEFILLDRRIISVEYATSINQDRWGKISSFVIQLIWIVIAAWILFKLNLNAPPVP